ncbi:RNA polymerase sigma factor [Armatimonas sp.]|uniref:RNA polymerase sigma factor n=1 Tax=Armatimonas sp. TaxID=1872638 RepID=UPI00286AE642|nr:RNA polymerase sigma factor [Armatimonas sp.]
MFFAATRERNQDDEKLRLAAARAGDSEALGALLTPHEALLFRVCLGVLGNRADAEDAVQEALLQAIRGLTRPGGFLGRASLKTWLVRIALNACGQQRRKRRETEEIPAGWVAHDNTEKAVLDRVLLQEALAALTDRQRAVLVLKEAEGWSVKEIAVGLGLREKQVDNELYRGKQALARWRKEREQER